MLDLSRDSNNPMNVKTRVRLGLKQSRFCGPYVHDPFKIFARVRTCMYMHARARACVCTSYIEILLCSSFEIERNLELLINDESHRLTYIFNIFNFFDFKEKKIIIDRKKVIFFYIYIFFFTHTNNYNNIVLRVAHVRSFRLCVRVSSRILTFFDFFPR